MKVVQIHIMRVIILMKIVKNIFRFIGGKITQQYESDLDIFLKDFKKNRKSFSDSQIQEKAKYAAISKLRDEV